MIYVGTTRDDGGAIYFDIHSAERLGKCLCISGTIGDGSYEGEVLIELGNKQSVTFADAWLRRDGYKEFVERCDLSLLASSLIDSVSEMAIFHPARIQPHGPHRVTPGSAVAEELPLWSRSS